MVMFNFLQLIVLGLLASRPAVSLSLGQAIQSVSSFEDGLKIASEFWLPSDPNLPPHYQQQVHHEKRQRWASQVIEKIFSKDDNTVGLKLLKDDRFDRIVHAAAMPHEATIDRPNKEGIWILASLEGLHGIIARKLELESICHVENILLPSTLKAIEKIIERACQVSVHYSLDQACQLHWIIKGLYERIPELEECKEGKELQQRVSVLPFDIVPRGLDWNEISPSSPSEPLLCDKLIDEIPFNKDTIVTRRGQSVTERRGTAWIAKEGIGALAYSGKLMNPKPIPSVVSKAMRLVEDRLSLESNFFDCALCNHYADASAACKFHTDPEHGSFWHRTTVVVAAGSDRKFAFKPINADWNDWDPLKVDSQQATAAAIHLFSGDLVVMKDNCNDDFYHAVHSGESDNDRVSLVLKRALDRNGKKGHGEQGQGRRSRRKLRIKR